MIAGVGGSQSGADVRRDEGADDDEGSASPSHSAPTDPGHSARSRRIHACPDNGGCDDTWRDAVGDDGGEPPTEITDPERARAIALRHIEARARTAGELRQILDRRRVVPAVAEQVIARFVEVGLVDDADFARQWVATRQTGKSASRARLKRELAGKGVDPLLIAQALDQAMVPEAQVALDFARRRAKTMSGLDRATITRRLAGQLTRRGFAPAVVRSVVVEVVNEASGGGNIVGDE